MQDDQEYLSLLSRARESLPEPGAAHERLVIPELDVLVEGNNTVIRNFVEVAKVLNREADEMLAYILREIGTSGSLEGQRVICKGKINKQLLEDRIRSYITDYVVCMECGKPDTHLEKEGRILRMMCEACGAFHPVRVKKSSKVQESDSVKEGDIVEMTIVDTGKRGDGVARTGSYTIYIPGTIKGETVKVKIDKIRGTMAFGHPVRE